MSKIQRAPICSNISQKPNPICSPGLASLGFRCKTVNFIFLMIFQNGGLTLNFGRDLLIYLKFNEFSHIYEIFFWKNDQISKNHTERSRCDIMMIYRPFESVGSELVIFAIFGPWRLLWPRKFLPWKFVIFWPRRNFWLGVR